MTSQSYKIRVSARGIVLHERHILLNRFSGGAYYNIPGGGIEQGETAPVTAVREVWEEAGIKVGEPRFLFCLEYEPAYAKFLYGHTHTISLFFACALMGSAALSEPTVPDINPDDASIVSAPVWVPLSDLAHINLVPHIGQNLIRYAETGVFEPAFFEEPYGV